MTTQPQPDPAPVAPVSLRAAVIARVLDVDTDASRRLAHNIERDEGIESRAADEIRRLAAALDSARKRIDALTAPDFNNEAYDAGLLEGLREGNEERAALRAELAAVTAALPDAGVLEWGASLIEHEAGGDSDAAALRAAAAAIRALPSAGDVSATVADVLARLRETRGRMTPGELYTDDVAILTGDNMYCVAEADTPETAASIAALVNASDALIAVAEAAAGLRNLGYPLMGPNRPDYSLLLIKAEDYERICAALATVAGLDRSAGA